MFVALLGLAFATLIALTWYRSQRRQAAAVGKTSRYEQTIRGPLKPVTQESAAPAIRMSSSDGDEESTPKARPVMAAPPIPVLDLSSDDQHSAPTSKSSSTLSASITPPQQQAKSSLSPDSSRSLMPPPLRPPRLSAPSTTSTPSLRVPTTTGPLPNRGPPGRSPASIRPGMTANTAGARNKVILTPGHSPLDWAALAKSSNLSGLAVGAGLQRVTPSMLCTHHGRKGQDAWSSYKGKVYNISPYLDFHPGGRGELMRAAGKDGEKLFNEYHSWVNWDTMLNACLVGIMVSEGEGEGLDELD